MKNIEEQTKLLEQEGARRKNILTLPMGEATFIYCEWDIVEGPFVGLPLYTYGYKFNYKGKTYGDYVELSCEISLEVLATVFSLFVKQKQAIIKKLDSEVSE